MINWTNTKPPSQLPSPSRNSLDFRIKLLIGLALIPTIFFGTFVGLRIFGLICPYSVPTGAMTPAVSAGDHVLMEGVSYLFRQPRRGDIVVFKTDDLIMLHPNQLYIKRVVGEPNEHVRLSGDRLFISDKLTVLSNDFGKITYGMPQISPTQTNVIVPDSSYFVLGDEATNSYDSRFFGSVPRANITGRIWFCFWPPQRMGLVR